MASLNPHYSIRCPRLLSPILPPTAYHEHVLLGNERLISATAYANATLTVSKRAWCMSFPASAPQREAAAIPEMKLSYFLYPYYNPVRLDTRIYETASCLLKPA
jgi:hypothetical protein